MIMFAATDRTCDFLLSVSEFLCIDADRTGAANDGLCTASGYS